MHTFWNTILPKCLQWHLWQCEGCSMLASGDLSNLTSSRSFSLWRMLWNRSCWKHFPKISAQGREFQFNIISGYRYAGRPIFAADICVCTCIGIGQFFSKIIFKYFFLPWFTDSSTVDVIIVSFLWYELREKKPYRLQILAQEKSVSTYRLRLMKKNLIGIVP